MAHWKINVLYLGHIRGPKSAITPGLDDDLVLEVPYLAFLLQKEGRNVLIDSGISDSFIVDGKAWGNLPAVGGRKYLLDALKRESVTPEDIDTVIYTHLHNDHAGNCNLFSHAKIVVQKDEWFNLLDPLPVEQFRMDYDPNIIKDLTNMENVYKIDGDFLLEDGIHLYKTPGHSSGSQSVAVTTKKGVQVIVGDQYHLGCQAFPFQTEIIDMEGKKHKITAAPELYNLCIPSSIVYDYYAYYESAYKIRAIASEYSPEFILCGHEPSLLTKNV